MLHRYKLDLHTHSIISHDGGIDENGYRKLFEKGILDCVAITDHNEITFAKRMQAKFGNRIIIGEEVKTQDGEMIGLFLSKRVMPGTSAIAAAKAIHAQGGLIYIPHPFEKKRSSIQRQVLETIHSEIDIIEIFNARGFGRGKPSLAAQFAKSYAKVCSASSDAHATFGIGSAYAIIDAMPDIKTLLSLLQKARFERRFAPIFSLLTPRINRLKRKTLL